MQLINVRKLVLAVFTGIIMLFGIGAGHSLVSAKVISGHSMASMETSSQCQSFCPPVLLEQSKKIAVDENEVEPNPIPFWLDIKVAMPFVSYIVLFGSLGFIYKLRRPPDLHICFANIRQ